MAMGYSMEKTPIIWLTETTTQERALSPFRLDFELMYTIESFINENKETVVLLDDLNYLSICNGEDKALDFLKTINDIGSLHGGTILAPVDPDLFEDEGLARLEMLFDKVVDITRDKGTPIIDEKAPLPSYS